MPQNIIGGDAPTFAVHVKGSAINLHDWRSTWGLLLGQIVGSGAGWPAPAADCWSPDMDAGFPKLTPRFDYVNKPLEARETGRIKFLNDSTGSCWFMTWAWMAFYRSMPTH